MAKQAKRESGQRQLRLRVFAGPNGSGKSTIIQSVRDTVVNGAPIDFGYYINADDIARTLVAGHFSFAPFDLEVARKSIIDFALLSGLVDEAFTPDLLEQSFSLRSGELKLTEPTSLDKMAQIIARFLRETLLAERRRFSFETVFSHPSNIHIMLQAVAAGYKVYLYFVSTESEEINQYRVALRVAQGGHYVPPDKIAALPPLAGPDA